ncbi:ArsR/SmtB family transcription factor [Nocardioides sp.]|uniref:ArsR/SmtB family transcription factor n=1 Tax=Nocardioides sp. TaxID=35761 RepID=UPI0037833455
MPGRGGVERGRRSLLGADLWQVPSTSPEADTSTVTASTSVEVHLSRQPVSARPESAELEDSLGASATWAGAGELLTAVADPVRWTVLQRLGTGTACVCELQDQVSVAPNLLSYHLRVLREAGLVTTSRRGRWVDYSLAPGAFDRLVAALPAGGGP